LYKDGETVDYNVLFKNLATLPSAEQAETLMSLEVFGIHFFIEEAALTTEY
jgi:hypothetical protein